MPKRRSQGSISPILSRAEKTTGRKEKKTILGYKIEFRGIYLGFCKRKADAKKRLADKTATSKSGADGSIPVRRFRYVYPCCRAGKWRWVARIGSNYREFQKEKAAATYISELCGKPITKLKLGKRSRLSTPSAQDRFSALCLLFAGWEPAVCAQNTVAFTLSVPACTFLRCWRKSTLFVSVCDGRGVRLRTWTVCPSWALLALIAACK